MKVYDFRPTKEDMERVDELKVQGLEMIGYLQDTDVFPLEAEIRVISPMLLKENVKLNQIMINLAKKTHGMLRVGFDNVRLEYQYSLEFEAISIFLSNKKNFLKAIEMLIDPDLYATPCGTLILTGEFAVCETANAKEQTTES